MKVVELPIAALLEASWNPNTMDQGMLDRLRESISRFGLVVPLVVRPLGDGGHEVIGGNQRLAVLQEMGIVTAPCIKVQADDAHARLLAQVLNFIRGEDDLGLRGELVRSLLESMPAEEIIAILPETADSLKALISLGQEGMAAHFAAWQQAQAARLKHLQFQLTKAQLEVVEEVLASFLAEVSAGAGGNPNRRGLALYNLCLAYLKGRAV